MAKSSGLVDRLRASCLGAWRRVLLPLARAEGRARRSRRGSQVDAQAEALKREIRDSGFVPCPFHARRVAAERLSDIIAKRGPGVVDPDWQYEH